MKCACTLRWGAPATFSESGELARACPIFCCEKFAEPTRYGNSVHWCCKGRAKRKKVTYLYTRFSCHMQWGLFTKWRRLGSAGHFYTRVHAGCMAGCVRSRKTHLRRATFCSFCLNTLRVILTDDLCVRRT